MDSEFFPPALAALFGIVAPFIVSLIKTWAMPKIVVQAVVLLVSLFFGFLALLVSDVWVGGVSWQTDTLIAYATAVFTVATIVYQVLIRGTDLNARLEAFGAPRQPLALGGSSGSTGGSRPGPGL